MPEPNDVRLYQDAMLRTLLEDRDVRLFNEAGREFFYRPGQLLVAPQDLDRVRDRLRAREIVFRDGQGFGGVARLLLNVDVDIPRLVSELRDPGQWPPNERVPAVQPHHVTIGSGNIMGSPFGPPVPAAALAAPDPARKVDGAGVTVGICDTGIWKNASGRHPLWLGGSYTVATDDEDALYDHGTVLAWEGGHGTFVAGVLRQAAPGVRFDPEPACLSTGIGDEEMLVTALAALDLKVAIINLSLGCFTQDNLAPMPMANALADALAARNQQAAVVAAAGNAGTSRPTWPAAFNQVVAVAAVTASSEGPAPAEYSSFGSWVDACADGDRTSTYVDGTWQMPGAPVVQFAGFARWVGTSFAAPVVSGWLATMMSAKKISAAQAALDLLAQPKWHPEYGVLVT